MKRQKASRESVGASAPGEQKAPLSLPPEAVEFLARVRANPSDEEAWDELDEYARSTQKPDGISQLYRTALNGELGPELIELVGKRAVAFHEEWYEDPTHVIGILRSVVERAPSADWAFERLSLLLTMAERWDDLLAAYDAQLEACTDREKKKALLDEAARIAKDFAGSADRAVGYLKQLVPLRPEDAQLAQSLERRLVLSKRYRDLIDVWTARIPVLSSAEVLSTRAQIAATWLEKLGEAETSLGVVRTILSSEKGEAEAARLLEKIGTHEASAIETRREALGLLKERFAATGHSEDVVRAIGLLLDVANDAEERIALRSEAASLLSAAGRTGDAVEHAAEWLVLEPTRKVKENLFQLVTASGEHDRYSDALVRAAARVQDGELRVEFLLEAGREQQEALHDGNAAIALYTRVLEDQAAEASSLLEAGRRLLSLLTAPEQARERLSVLERLSELEPEEADVRRVLGEAAALAEKTTGADHALALWRRRLERDSKDAEALDAIIALLETNERWEELVGALEQRHDASSDPGARRADLVRIADVHRARLDDLPKAIEAWRRIEKEFGATAETMDALADLSAAAQRWSDVTALLRAAATQVEDPEHRAQHLSRMGDVYRTQRGQLGRAVDAYGEALDIHAVHENARQGLRELLDDEDVGSRAVETLARSYASSGEWRGTLELVERRVAGANSDEFRRDVLLEAAGILERRAEDPKGALAHVRRAFALVCEPDIERELVRLAGVTDGWAECAGGYADAIAASKDEARKAELLFSQGAILEKRLVDLPGALQSYSRVTELQPENVEAAVALVRVAGISGRWDVAADALVSVSAAKGAVDNVSITTFESVSAETASWEPATRELSRSISRASSITARVQHDLKQRLAIWHRDRREDLDSAEAVLREAAGALADPDTLRMLAELERRHPDRALTSTLLKLAEVTDDDLDVLYEAGTVALHAVHDPVLSTEILEKVLAISSKRWKKLRKAEESVPEALPRYAAWAVTQLVQLRLDADEGKAAVDLLERGAKLPFAPEKSRDLRYRAAELAAELVGDTARAVELCRGILSEEPNETATIALLAGLYAKEDRLEELLDLRRRELSLSPPVERRLLLRLDIARVGAKLGRDSNERIAVLRDNLGDRPGHLESVEELAHVLEIEGRHSELHAELVRQAELVQQIGDAHAASLLWARAGKLAETALGDVERALEAYRRSVALEASVSVLDSLAAIHTARNEHGAAVGWLEKRLERTGRGAEDLPTYRDTVLRLARSYRAAGHEDLARRCLTDALAEDPGASELRAFLAELYRDAEDWALLGPLLAEGVKYAVDGAEKVSLLRQAAMVHRRKLGTLDAAIPLLEQAAALAPGDRSVRLALADALRTGGRFAEAQNLLDKMLAEFGRRRTPERAAVHYYLARIAQAQGDLRQALSQLESASSIERTDPKILRLLGDVARQKGEFDAAERAYRALLLIVRRSQPTAGSSDGEEEPVTASEVIYDLHKMALDQGQADRASELLDSAFETASSNNLEALRFERVLRSAGRTDLVLRVLDARLERIAEPAAAADILVARADLLAETGKLAEALDSLMDALGKTPGSVPLLSSAHDLAVRAHALPRYVERLEGLAESARGTDPLLASDLFMRLGLLAETELSDLDRAARHFEKSLSTGRRALRAYRALLRVTPEKDTERVSRVLQKFVESSDQDETDVTPRNEALYRLSEMLLAVPSTVEEGAKRLEQALDRQADYKRAESLIAPLLTSPPVHSAVARVFERVARAIGGDARLFDALFLRCSLPDAPFETLREAVDLAKRLGDAERQGAVLERLVEVARGEHRERDVLPSMVDLAKIREAQGNPSAAAELLTEAARHSEGSEAFALELRVAELAASSLGDLRRAAKVYETLRNQEPTDVRVWKPLLEVYRKLSAFAELEACIAETVQAVTDPSERNHLRMERGRILLEDPARWAEAETVLREVLDEEPDHLQASVVLADLYERTGRVDEQKVLLDRLLQAAKDRKDGDAVAAIALKIGRGLEATDRDGAIRLYRESLEWSPRDRALLEALLAMHGPDGDPRDRAFVLSKLLEVETGESAARTALELARIAGSLDDPGGVERALLQGYRACPSSKELREHLVSWYTEREDFSGLIDVIASDARHRKSKQEAVEQLREAARIARERLSDPARAADLLGEASALAPNDAALLEDLVHADIEAGRAERALSVLNDTITSGGASSEARARLLSLRAKLRPQVEGREIATLRASIEDLDQALSLAGGGYETVLAELLEEQRTVANAMGDGDAERAATMRLAHLLQETGEQRRGLELLVAWVKRMPNDAEAVNGLGQFAAKAEKWSAAARAYQRLVEITDGPEQIEAAVRLANACERAGTPMEARPALEQVYAKAPQSETVRAQLRRMYEAAGAYAELASLMISEAEQAGDDETKFSRFVEAGDLSLRVPNGNQTAVDAYRHAHAIKPDDHRVTIRLADTLGALGDIEGAAGLLDKAIEAFGKKRSPELSELQHGMARVGRLAGDWEAVFAWLDAAVQTDRTNGAAASELAVVAMERGELDIAIKALQAITLLKNEAPMSKAEAYLRQAMIAEQRGDPKKAVFLAKRAATQDPTYGDAKAFIERLGG